MVASQGSGVVDAAGMGDQADAVANLGDEIHDADGLVLGVEAALQALVVGGDAGRAGVLVALEGLDAAEGEHEAAGGGREIGAGAERPGDLGRGDQLARGDDLDAVAQALAGEGVDDHGQGLADGQADIVHQRHGRGTCAAVAGIDGDEVGCGLGAALVDFAAQVVEPAVAADDELDADRLAGHLADVADHVEQVG